MSTEQNDKAIEAAGQDFIAAQKAWRDGRPEYAAVTAAIRAERGDDELLVLAARAGATQNELAELRRFRERALSLRAEAARYAAAQKKANELEQQWQDLSSQRAKARTPALADELDDQLAALAEPRAQSKRGVAELAFSASQVEAAEKIGVI